MSIPGIVATTMLNRHYDSHENYLTALAEALPNEYCAIHGSTVPADLLVLATGYYPQMGAGPPCARRGDGGAHRPGLGHRRGWRAGMYKRTPQQGLWFIAGGLAQCRINSKYLALQIKAMQLGKLEPLAATSDLSTV
jgi:hypothetical protein